jgi:hypothetical protein
MVEISFSPKMHNNHTLCITWMFLPLQSMVSFLRDPKGDLPWDEESSAENIVHIMNPPQLGKLLKKERKPILLMFYAPCKL